MQSTARVTSTINLPLVECELSMIPFDIATQEGLNEEHSAIVRQMLEGISASGTGFFTLHGKKLTTGGTLRRGAPHTDGNYEPHNMTFGTSGGNGWKVGENGPPIDSELHKRQYLSEKGGIILASNFESCLGWLGEYSETPRVGGDCSHIELGNSFMLKSNCAYYGNNHFVHESLPVNADVHRVFARITLPENHCYQ